MKRHLRYTPELAGLRGLAALLVCFYHFVERVRPVPSSAGVVPRLLAAVAAHDYITVDVFFVLSGFLITSLLLADKEKSHFYYNFYWRRVLRIIPVFLVTMVLLWHSERTLAGYMLLCFLFIANFSARFGITYLSPLWTLCIEEQFYLVWPHVIRRCSIKAIAWVSVGLIAFSTLARIPYFFQYPVPIGFTWYRLDGLGFGALAACVYVRGDEVSSKLRRLVQILASDTLLYVAVAGFLILPVFPDLSGNKQMLLSISLTNFLMFRFIYSVVIKGRHFPGLASLPMLYMGSISYAFYMFHEFVIHHFLDRWGLPDATKGWAFMGHLLVIYAVTIAAATASQFLIEKPAQRLRRYVLARPADVRESLALQLPSEQTYQRTLT